MTAEATKAIDLVIAASANSMAFTEFPSIAVVDGAIVYTAGTIEPTPDAVTVTLGDKAYSTLAAWAETYENTDDPDNSGAFWDDFTPIEGHDIVATPYPHPNDWLRFAVFVVATKAGYFPLTITLGPEEVPRFALAEGGLALTGGTDPAEGGQTLTLSDTTLTTYPSDSESIKGFLVMEDGTEIEIAADGDEPALAEIEYLDGTTSKNTALTYPTHQADDMAVALFSGSGLGTAALVADGWVIQSDPTVKIGSYETFIATKRMLAPGTTFPTITNLQRVVLGMYRGVSVTAPVSGVVMALNNSTSATAITLAGIADRPAGGRIARFRGVNPRNGTFPADAGVTARVAVNDTDGTFYAFALGDTNAVATDLAEASVNLDAYTARSISFAVGLRAQSLSAVAPLLALFSGAEQGGLWLPSDTVTVFSTAAGSVNVTADADPVGRIEDQSGRGNDLTQATAAARPAFGVDAGIRWLEPDGVDDFLTSDDVSITGAAVYTCVLIRPGTAVSGERLISLGTTGGAADSDADTRAALLMRDGTTNNWTANRNGEGAQVALPPDTWSVVESLLTATEHKIRRNGGTWVTDTFASKANFAVSRLRLGASAAGTAANFSTAGFGGGVVLDYEPSAGEMTTIRDTLLAINPVPLT